MINKNPEFNPDMVGKYINFIISTERVLYPAYNPIDYNPISAYSSALFETLGYLKSISSLRSEQEPVDNNTPQKFKATLAFLYTSYYSGVMKSIDPDLEYYKEIINLGSEIEVPANIQIIHQAGNDLFNPSFIAELLLNNEIQSFQNIFAWLKSMTEVIHRDYEDLSPVFRVAFDLITAINSIDYLRNVIDSNSVGQGDFEIFINNIDRLNQRFYRLQSVTGESLADFEGYTSELIADMLSIDENISYNDVSGNPIELIISNFFNSESFPILR